MEHKIIDSAFSKELEKAYRALSVEEEREIAVLASNGNKKAQERLANSQIKSIIQMARMYADRNNTAEFLVTEGYLGAMHAASKFDITSDVRFYTYASWWIKAFIQKAIKDNQLVKTPSSVEDKEILTQAKLLRKQGMGEEALRLESQITTPKASFASMDTSCDDEGMHNYFAAPEDDIQTDEVKAIRKILKKIPASPNKAILTMHFIGQYSLEDIASQMGCISKQAVCSRLKIAMEELTSMVKVKKGEMVC